LSQILTLFCPKIKESIHFSGNFNKSKEQTEINDKAIAIVKKLSSSKLIDDTFIKHNMASEINGTNFKIFIFFIL